MDINVVRFWVVITALVVERNMSHLGLAVVACLDTVVAYWVVVIIALVVVKQRPQPAAVAVLPGLAVWFLVDIGYHRAEPVRPGAMDVPQIWAVC